MAAFPNKSHTPITYPFALIKDGKSKEAKDFLSFLTSDAGLAIFERYGFRRN